MKAFSNDIGMEFGLRKCAQGHFLQKDIEYHTFYGIITFIKDITEEQNYKYFGINEGSVIQYSDMKEKIRNE